MIADAKELYLKYGGGSVEMIEAEMKDRGWPFYRQMLYDRRHSHGVTTGWPERFGWKKLLGTKDERKRTRGRNRFDIWLRTEFPEWTWTWKYQRYIYKKLARVTAGRGRRLMIFMPPRHGKSETVTIRYTAWRLLQDPQLNVILGSYNQTLANKFSRKIKRIVQSAAQPQDERKGYASDGGIAPRSFLQPDGKAEPFRSSSGRSPRTGLLNTASEWETPGGGVVRVVGVGGGVAGFGAGLIVIDDPVRNRADAESEAYRERVWDWFNDDIYTRLDPRGSIILIQTRWHEDDLAGRLLKEMENGGEQWDVVSLPAIAEEDLTTETQRHGERKKDANQTNSPNGSPLRLCVSVVKNDPLGRKPGEALCPQRYDEAALERTKRKLGSYSFAALYQQSPAPAEGGRFKRAWFKNIVDKAPENLRWKRGYDLAVSTKTSADYTASFRCAKDASGNLYIADGFRKRIEFPDQRRYAIERMRTERSTEHGIESALHGKAFVQDLRRDARVGHIAFRSVDVDGDKLTRALAWLNLAEEGKVILVRGPWIDDFVDEVCRFPTGKHDDQVDAVSVAVSMLATVRHIAAGF